MKYQKTNMNSSQLFDLFQQHFEKICKLNVLGIDMNLSDTDPTAIIYCSNQFILDYKNKRIKFKNTSWMKCKEIPGDISENISWAAIINENKNIYVVVGNGNPFNNTTGILPMKNGMVIATPFK